MGKAIDSEDTGRALPLAICANSERGVIVCTGAEECPGQWVFHTTPLDMFNTGRGKALEAAIFHVFYEHPPRDTSGL